MPKKTAAEKAAAKAAKKAKREAKALAKKLASGEITAEEAEAMKAEAAAKAAAAASEAAEMAAAAAAAAAEAEAEDEVVREGYVIGRILECEPLKATAGGKALTKLMVAVREGGDADEAAVLQIVTNAKAKADAVVNRLVVVATEGATVGEIVVKSASVGGTKSQGMVCDCPSLGWKGGSAGAMYFFPKDGDFKVGDAPPAARPRG